MDFLNLPSTDRPIVAHTALGPQLGFLSLKGNEGISELFEFDVELASGTFMLDVRSMLGTDLTIEIETSAGAPRFLNGKVSDFELLGRERTNSGYYLYRAVVRPALWYLTQGQDSRIFQNKNVPAILKKVFDRYGFSVEYKLNETYRDWEYCVQYQESDFNFVSRLMEHEGIYYYFSHDNGQHTLILTDDVITHQTFPGYDVFTYYDSQGNIAAASESVLSWRHRAGMTAAKYSVLDYDFRKPQVKLDALTAESLSGDDPKIEMYEWQGGYQELDHADQYARLRMQELKVNQELITAETTVRGVAPGYLFTLHNHPRLVENQEYLVVSAVYKMSVAGYSSGTDRQDSFQVLLNAIPSSVQFRAPRITKQPKTSGPQTAKVVGPTGEELYTDKFGRIKAQFHWDREGKSDENSSCWIRVSSPWAGGGFGGLQLPRIGDEVVVDFIGGNPDRPIVLGRVYNASNMPPVDLPVDANISGFRTQSVFGDSSTENHLLFIDKLGQELVDLRAQYDMIVNVLNNLDIIVGNNRTESIGVNLKTTVGATEEREVGSDRTTTINGLETGNFNASRIEIVTGTQNVEVTEDDTFIVGGSQITDIGVDHTETIGGNDTINVTGAREETVTAGVTETYDTQYTQTINGPTTRTITGPVIDTITGTHIDTTTGVVIKTITGPLIDVVNGSSLRSYEGPIIDNLEASWNVTAAGNITFKAPKVKLDVPSTLFEKLNINHRFGVYTGSTFAFKTEQTGKAHAIALSKSDWAIKKEGKAFMSRYDDAIKHQKNILQAHKAMMKRDIRALKNSKNGLELVKNGLKILA
ncbi:MAG: type VI secretion system tip protein TssI/VgrG [Alcaligenaceae bacterium]|nr:type VI secretion system tip protein TssI/VgrG [Alcaligenaceae bacterium]